LLTEPLDRKTTRTDEPVDVKIVDPDLQYV